MTTQHPAPDTAVRTALGQGLAAHPEDSLVVLSAVRDGAGTIVDFHHDWANAVGIASAGRPLVGERLLEAYGRDATLFGLMCELVEHGGSRSTTVAFGGDSLDAVLHHRVFAAYLAAVDGDRVVCQYRDVTDLHRARAALEHEATHDDLTGVANRRHLRAHLERVLARVEESGSAVLVLLTDLDRFKQVNDVHGHGVGDQLLHLVAGRMRAATRSGDLVARYGGDEFVVVVADVADDQEADAVVERLRAAVTGPYRIDGATTVEVGLSVGRALVTAPTAAEDVLTLADRALYRAKEERGA